MHKGLSKRGRRQYHVQDTLAHKFAYMSTSVYELHVSGYVVWSCIICIKLYRMQQCDKNPNQRMLTHKKTRTKPRRTHCSLPQCLATQPPPLSTYLHFRPLLRHQPQLDTACPKEAITSDAANSTSSNWRPHFRGPFNQINRRYTENIQAYPCNNVNPLPFKNQHNK